MSNTYSPGDVVLSFAGYVLEDWERISVTYAKPTYTMTNGIRGKNTRVRQTNTAASIEIEISQASDANYVLNAIVAQDVQYGTGNLQVTLKDILGTEVFSSSESFLAGYPEKSYGQEIGTRTWTIHCLSSESAQSNEGWALGSLFDRATQLF